MRRFPILILALAAACAKQEPSVGLELLSQKPPTRLRVNEVLELRPAKGHHFNLQAPQSCADFAFASKSPRVLRCQITEPGTHAIAASVCDDAKSYCKFAKFSVIAKAPKGWKRGESVVKAERAAPKGDHRAIPGFIDNDPAEALARAKREKKLLLIDFYGIWCPPCNMLDEYVYGTDRFQEASNDFVRVALDADAPLSFEWKARFKVGGYPTVVVADAELNEIGRSVGYTPLGAYLKWLDEQRALRGEPIAKALKAEPTPARRKRIGEWRYGRKEYAEAVALLEKKNETYWYAKWKIAQKEGDKKAQTAALLEILNRFPDEVSFGPRVLDLAGVDESAGKERIDAAIASLRRWRKSPKLGETGYGADDLFDYEADLHKLRGDEKSAKAAYRKGAEYCEALARKSPLGVARAANMSRAYFLRVAGDVEQAKKVYEKLASAYANEFTFNYNYASTLNKLKEYEKAYRYAEKAEANAYGDNWLRSVHLKAKIELALKRTGDAKRTLESGLAEAVIPDNTDVRTYVYVKRLRELLTKIERGEEPA
jgi:thiol-disulfide isomerase/thioredoxin